MVDPQCVDRGDADPGGGSSSVNVFEQSPTSGICHNRGCGARARRGWVRFGFATWLELRERKVLESLDEQLECRGAFGGRAALAERGGDGEELVPLVESEPGRVRCRSCSRVTAVVELAAGPGAARGGRTSRA